MPELVCAAGAAGWLDARRPLKLSPSSRTGMIHGAYDAARPPRLRRGYLYRGPYPWQYRRGFARAFLAASAVRRGN